MLLAPFIECILEALLACFDYYVSFHAGSVAHQIAKSNRADRQRDSSLGKHPDQREQPVKQVVNMGTFRQWNLGRLAVSDLEGVPYLC